MENYAFIFYIVNHQGEKARGYIETGGRNTPSMMMDSCLAGMQKDMYPGAVLQLELTLSHAWVQTNVDRG